MCRHSQVLNDVLIRSLNLLQQCDFRKDPEFFNLHINSIVSLLFLK